MSKINILVDDLIGKSRIISLNEFITLLNDTCYSDLDTSFMRYFFELSREDNDGRFIVNHKKLIECGILNESSDDRTKKSLLEFGLEEDNDFVLVDTKDSERKKPIRNYMLTADAFKLVLIRAPKGDPKKYIRYFQFLEKSIRYYNMYQSKLKEISTSNMIKEKMLIEDVLSKLIVKVDNVIDLNAHIKEDEREAKFSVMSITASTNSKLDSISAEMLKKSDFSFLSSSNPKMAMALLAFLLNAAMIITYSISPEMLKSKML